jgi:hypothetical protein
MTPDEMRRRAQVCLDHAKRSRTHDERRDLEALAKQWHDLAAQAESEQLQHEHQ